MASFTPSKKTVQDFNSGVKYIDGNMELGIVGDAVHAESINNVIEGTLYSEEQAENAFLTANSAKSSADNAVSVANTANIDAKNAVSVANEAKITANTAISTAEFAKSTSESANSTADNAIVQSSIAETKANSAVSMANSANANANSAVETANEALSKINQAVSGSVIGVKGNAEEVYRTGNVNLTPANIGAVNKNGDTMTGELTNVKGQQVRGRKSVAITNTLVNEVSGFFEGAFDAYSRYFVIGDGGDKFLLGWQYTDGKVHIKIYNSSKLQVDGAIPFIEASKLAPSTANGWTIGGTNMDLPSEGMYLVSISNQDSPSAEQWESIGIGFLYKPQAALYGMSLVVGGKYQVNMGRINTYINWNAIDLTNNDIYNPKRVAYKKIA